MEFWLQNITLVIIGLSTVFTGLLLIALTMAGLSRLLNPRPVESETDQPQEGKNGMVPRDVMAAISLALHISDQEHLVEENIQMTLEKIAKPFSPWVMDAKGAYHTHRIRYQAFGSRQGITQVTKERG